jgi:hypothetical protein
MTSRAIANFQTSKFSNTIGQAKPSSEVSFWIDFVEKVG